MPARWRILFAVGGIGWGVFGCAPAPLTLDDAMPPTEPAPSPSMGPIECPDGTVPIAATDVAYQGQVCARPDGVLHGVLHATYPDGSPEREGRYEDGEKVGQWTWWDRDGRVNMQGRYQRDQKVGIWRSWSAGVLTEEGRYEDGEKVGSWSTWYAPDGQKKSEGDYHAGRKAGRWRRWHPNGQLAEDAVLVGGKYDGTVTVWHPNGQQARQGDYVHDVQIGEWIWWDADGAVIKRQSYVDGGVAAP
ncbi:MAG: toxin-antitoxin system YwqK family antitoxin [Myxococcota bacterium]